MRKKVENKILINNDEPRFSLSDRPLTNQTGNTGIGGGLVVRNGLRGRISREDEVNVEKTRTSKFIKSRKAGLEEAPLLPPLPDIPTSNNRGGLRGNKDRRREINTKSEPISLSDRPNPFRLRGRNNTEPNISLSDRPRSNPFTTIPTFEPDDVPTLPDLNVTDSVTNIVNEVNIDKVGSEVANITENPLLQVTNLTNIPNVNPQDLLNKLPEVPSIPGLPDVKGLIGGFPLPFLPKPRKVRVKKPKTPPSLRKTSKIPKIPKLPEVPDVAGAVQGAVGEATSAVQNITNNLPNV
jgi:hypothetical protein